MLSWSALTNLAASLSAPLIDPASRTWLPALLVAACVALLVQGLRSKQGVLDTLKAGIVSTFRALKHRSSLLDLQLLLGRQLLRAVGLLPAIAGSWFLATWSVRSIDAITGMPPSLGLPSWAVALLYTAVLFVVWDASRFVLHLALHRVPVLWAFHQVHHSAEVLTPLTFHRLHPVESALYQLRGLLVTTAVVVPFFWLFRGQLDLVTVLGVHSVGFVFSVATGNLRHSHVWLRFGERVERWLISPAQHQMHHSADLAESSSNYGTWLSVWDRMHGTLRIAGASAPSSYGVHGPRNHSHNLLSAWFGPFAGLFAPIVATSGLALLLVPTPNALADDSVQDGEEDDATDGDETSDQDAEDDDFTVIVEADGGVPTVAGSAQVVDEEQLEQMEYNDVSRVLAAVPGIYVRGEDGYGLRPNIGIRGANSDRSAKITLLEDGIPLAPAPYAAPAAYYFPMTTRLAGIEVFKGPAAIQHGPQTVGGAVNTRTRRVPRQGPDAAVDLAYGLNQTGKVHAWAGTGGSRGGVLAEIVHLGTRGFKDLDGGGSTGFQRTEVMFKARSEQSLSATTHSSVELKLGAAREASNESYLGLSLPDLEATPYRRYAATQLDNMQWHRSLAHLTWQVRVGRDFQIRTTAYHHYLDRTWTKFNRFSGGPDAQQMLQYPTDGAAAVYMALLAGQENSATDDELLQIGTNARTFHSGGVQTRARWRVGGDKVSALWDAGVRVHFDDVVRLHTEDPHRMSDGQLVRSDLDTEVTQDRHSAARAVSAHTHGDVTIGKLHVQPGARVEWVHTAQQRSVVVQDTSNDRLHLLPGLGALAEISEGVGVFVGAHRGFSPVAPGQDKLARPEVSWNYELGLRAMRGERHGEVALFASDYQNLTGECTISGGCDGASVGQQYSAGRVLVAGVESAASDELPLAPGFTLPVRASYTFTHATFAQSFNSAFPQFGQVTAGDRLPYVPAHQGSVSVGLSHDRFRLSLAGEVRSGMLDAAGSEIGEFDVPALFVMDASANVKVAGPAWVYATATNLTGNTAAVSWRPLGARASAPRQVTVGIKLR